MRLLVIHCRRRREISRREILLGPLSVPELASSVAELQVDVLLCGALSLELQHALEQRGVRVWPHLCGEVDDVIKAFGCGQLGQDQFHIPGCHCGYCCQQPGVTRGTGHRRSTSGTGGRTAGLPLQINLKTPAAIPCKRGGGTRRQRL